MRWLLALLILFQVSFALAQGETQTAEDWAWDQIRAGKVADFNARCGQLDPKESEGWTNDCRNISNSFIQTVLTDPSRQAMVPHHRVSIRGAHVTDGVDLSGMDCVDGFGIVLSRIDGGVSLDDSHILRWLSFDGSVITGDLSTDRMHGESALYLREAVINGNADLRSARIDGSAEMDGTTFAKELNADDLSVGGDLYMRNGATFSGDVEMIGAKVGGQLDLSNASFAATLNANSISVGAALFMGNKAKFAGDVILLSAKIGDQVDMADASFAKTLNADKLRVGSSLFMRDGATFNGDVILRGAKIGDQIDMTKATFAKKLDGETLSVGHDLLMYGDTKFSGTVNMRSITVPGSLYLNSATIAGFDFTGAVIMHEFNISSLAWLCPNNTAPSHWKLGDLSWRGAHCGNAGDPPLLNLRNVQVGVLQDSDDAWPPSLDLEGFHYEHIGGLILTKEGDMRARPADQWRDWLARDPTFSTQPYVQLASVLAAAGYRDNTERTQYAGRQRERDETLHHAQLAWSRDWWEAAIQFAQWVWLTVLCVVTGYGIGLYTFRVLYWVLGLALLGTAILWFSPVARRQGFWWRFGAALHRLLPVVQLNKEFEDFFDNPAPARIYEPRNLNRFQSIFFTGLAMAGWVLGIFLLAALGGLMSKG